MTNANGFIKHIFILVVLALFFAIIPAMAHAQSAAGAAFSGGGVLDDVALRFRTISAGWGHTLEGFAEKIFLGLVSIGLIWNCGFLALQKADISEFFTTFIRWLMFVGFFWWLTQNAAHFAMTIIESFAQMGAAAGGLPKLGPSGPLNVAFEVLEASQKAMSIMHPIDNIVLRITLIIIFIALVVVAANMLITLCTAWVLAYAGSLLVGFGAVSWTSDIATNYFRSVLNVAVTYMVMLLLVGGCQQVMTGFVALIDQGTDTFEALLVVMVVAITLALLVHKIPPLVGALTGGQGGHHGSLGIGAAVGAMAMAGAAIGSGGAALAAKGAAGAASGGASGAAALGEAAAGGEAAAAGESAPGAGGDESSGGGGSGGSGGSPLASAMGSGGGGDTGAASGAGGSPSGSGSGASAKARAVASMVGSVAHAAMTVGDAAVGGSGYSGGGGSSSSMAGPGGGSSSGGGNAAEAAANEPAAEGADAAPSQQGAPAAPASSVAQGTAPTAAADSQEVAREAGRSEKGQQAPVFNGDSISGHESFNPADEIASFRDKA